MKDIDVFISHHTKSCLKVTQAVAHSLEERGIRVWYAPRDTEDAYAKNIIEIIDRCKVFILILNHESSESFDVLNEINYVAERIRKKEQVHVIPFKISNDEISADAKYYLGRLHWLDAVTPPLEKRIIELTDRVSYILKENNDIIPKKEVDLISTNILNNIHFIGRNKELLEIEEGLKNNKCVFLQGIGGVGKSEIAKKYANIHKKEYDKIIFAKYVSDLEQLIISENAIKITNIYRTQNSQGILESDKEFFERKLEILKEIAEKNKILIIIDNFDVELDENLENFLSGNYDVIFTTRYDFSFIGNPVIQVNAMQDMDELLQLFSQNYQVLNMIDLQKDFIIKIINLIKGHTLGIELIAKYMQSSRKKPEEMYKLLEKGINPNIAGKVNHLYENNTIYNYIKTLFDLSKITEEEKDVLKNLSMFSIEGIEFGILLELCDYEDGFTIDNLIKKNWILHDWQTDNIALHPLIRDVVKNECEPNLENCKNLFKNLTSMDSWKMHQTERLKYEGIILNIYNNYRKIDKENIESFIGIAKFLRDLGYYEQAEKLLLEILEIQKQEYTENSIEVAKTYDLLRFVNNKCYKVDKAIDYNEKAINVLRSIETDGYLLADYIKSRAYSYLKDRQPLEAKKLLDEVTRIYNKILPENHYKIGNTNIALSRLHYQLNEYDKAKECAYKAYNILSLKYDKESTDIATALMSLGQANCKLGNYKEGLEQLQEALRIRRLNFHQDDFSIMDALECLADGYIGSKQYDEAQKCLEEVKKVFEKKMNNDDKWLKRIDEKLKICK